MQISTEASNKIIVAVGVTQEGTDYNQLADGIDRVKANMTVTPEQMSSMADTSRMRISKRERRRESISWPP